MLVHAPAPPLQTHISTTAGPGGTTSEFREESESWGSEGEAARISWVEFRKHETWRSSAKNDKEAHYVDSAVQIF